jgi:carbon-monoxide dehydrogenase iron sulfur subunit
LRKLVVCDSEKCTGCRICELACSEAKERLYNPRRSRIRLVSVGPLLNKAMACRLCEDPACVKSCPRIALRRSKENGVILVDENKCNGCDWCLEACSFGALAFQSDKKSLVVCDLCEGDPECVRACPYGALKLVTPNALAQRGRFASVKLLFSGKE